jgi:hypothetical protein
MNPLKSASDFWAIFPIVLVTLLTSAPLHAQEVSYPCQGLLHDYRDNEHKKIFLDDWRFQTSDKSSISFRSDSDLAGITGFVAGRHELHEISDAIYWRAWYVYQNNGRYLRDELRVNKFNGHFNFQTKQESNVLISIDGICRLN